jgi:hypothetical protein
MTIADEEKKSSLEYGEHGYKHFHPWFLADLNPSSIDEYFRLVMKLLRQVDPILNREEYWFFRGDINILMMWYRVSFLAKTRAYDFAFRWCGPRTTSCQRELHLDVQLWNSFILIRSCLKMFGENLNCFIPSSLQCVIPCIQIVL